MARMPRMHEIGDVHHVMSHAVDQLRLFQSPVDYYFFLDVLNEYLISYDCHCYGFALMPNHYHLIVRPSGDKEHFSRMMQSINTKLAMYVNAKNERKGPVFWDRFKSIPTRDLDYLRNLIMYLHVNPVKAGLVSGLSDLANYRWCSHSLLFEENNPYPWLKTDFMKCQLGFDSGSPIGYLSGLSHRCGESFDPWYYDRKRKRPMPAVPEHARSEESSWVISKLLEVEKERIFKIRLHRQPKVLWRLLNSAKEHFGVEAISGKHRSSENRTAFQVFVYWAVDRAGYSGTLIARLLGCHPTTVLKAVPRGKLHAEKIPFPVEIDTD